MSYLHDKLGRAAITIISVSIIVFTISVFIAHLIDSYSIVFDLIQKSGGSYEVLQNALILLLVSELLYILKIIIMIDASQLIGKIKSPNMDALHNDTRNLVLIIAIYILVVLIALRFINIDIDLVGLPRTEAYYISIIAILIVAHFLKKTKATTLEGKVLRAIGQLMETAIIVVVIAIVANSELPYLEYKSLLLFTPSRELLLIITVFALISILLIGAELSVLKVTSPTSNIAAVVYIVRRVSLVTLSLIIAIYMGIQAPGYLQETIGLFIDFADIKSSFILLAFIASVLFVIGLVIGIVAGSMFIIQGVRSKSLISVSIARKELESRLSQLEGYTAPRAEEKPEREQPIKEEKPVVETIKCPFCGMDIPKDAKFCPNCGAYLQGEEGTRVYSAKEEKQGQ